MSSEPAKDEDSMQSRPDSPPLGVLDPSRIQNPLVVNEQQNQQMQQAFVMPEQPRQLPCQVPQQLQQPPQHWQRTPTMSPANIFQQDSGSGTPGSQRSSTGTPNLQMSGGGGPQGHMTPQHQQQFSFHESPAHSQGTPMTPQSAGAPPGSNCGTPQSQGGPPQQQQVPGPVGPGPQYDYQMQQMQQQQQAQAQAMAQAQQQQQQQQFGGPGAPGGPQMMDPSFRAQGHPQMMGMHPQMPPGYNGGPPPQPGQAQWQQQQMFLRQQQQQAAQQRVQRVPVPYPQGAYPQGVPGPMTPGYPPQPSPATRTTPGSAGPGTGPPGTPQRPQYPPGTNPGPPPGHPQFAYPPGQPQGTPTGPPGPGYPGGHPGTPTFPSPAPHQMFRQGPPTGPQGMRPQYISPQAGPPQPAPGTPHRFAPQTPGSTSSPHFAPAPGQMVQDIRSPSLMSPNQQQVMQQQQQQQAAAAAAAAAAQAQQHTPVMVRNMHPEMAPQMGQMRPITLPPQQPSQPPQGTPQPPHSATPGGQFPQFRAGPVPQQLHHDPNTFPMPQVTHDPELFLAGLVIHCFDVDRLIQDRLDRDNLEFMIKYHGGEIEFDAEKFNEKLPQITHVLLDSYRNPAARPSLENRKRLVSMQWIADILEKGAPEIPWKLAHLPGPHVDGQRPYPGKLFSLSGFDETERPAISFMAEALGAQVAPFLSKKIDLLIAKGPAEKVQKAMEWNIPVVTYQWLADTYVCNINDPSQRPNVANPRYHLGSPCHDVNTVPGNIEISSADFAQMIRCWKQAVIITDQAQEKAKQSREEMAGDKFNLPAKRLASQSAAPTDEAIKTHQKTLSDQAEKYAQQQEKRSEKERAGVPIAKLLTEFNLRPPQPQVHVFFGDGFEPETLTILQRKVQFLGGKCAENVETATHVVLMSGRRSLTLLEAIVRGKNIVDPEWIVNSYRFKKWLDTLDYFLNDKKMEAYLAYNCKRSVLRARIKRVFEDIEFHVTKFVEPSQQEIVKLIEAGGGIVHPHKPDPVYLAKCIESDQPFIIISCEKDARFLGYLAEANLPIYNVDLVLFAILRQNIEPLPQYRIPIPIVINHQQKPQQTQPAASQSAQKVA